MKWFVLNVGEILIDKKYIPVVQSTIWSLIPDGYVLGSSGKYKGQLLHRVIAKLAGLDIPDEVDHINGNPRNNQILNLRPATHAENMRNRKIQSNNTSGYPGVSYRKDIQKWMAYIRINRKMKNLGYFDTAEVAYAVYCKAARQYHGEFARV